MRKVVKRIDEDTLAIVEEVIDDGVEELDEERDADIRGVFTQALECDPEEFYRKYREMKDAEASFKEIYEPFKEKLLELHKTAILPKSVVVGGVKVTYVQPSTRTSIDSKKLKEEEPDLAKKYSKTTNVSATVRLEEV